MELNFIYNKEEKLKTAFKVFDKNNDGKITAGELQEVLGSIYTKLIKIRASCLLGQAF